MTENIAQSQARDDLEHRAAVRWVPALGSRLFLYDAFISHNRRHDATVLARQLANAGCAVWHDADADLADRRIQERISRAIMASRFVIVVVDPRFRDTSWVRAEYGPGLARGLVDGISRTLVVQIANSTAVPADLAECPRFSNSPNGVDALVRHLRDANSWHPLPPPGPRPLPALQVTRDQFSEAAWEANARAAFAAKLAFKFAAGDDVDEQAVMGWRIGICRLETLPDERIVRIMRGVADYCCRSASTDDRANGLHALLHLAALGDRAALADVSYFLAREAVTGSPAVVRIAFDWLEEDHARLPAIDRHVIALAAASAAFEVRTHRGVVSMLDEALRARIWSDVGLDLALLGPSERLNLARQKLQVLLRSQPDNEAGIVFGSEYAAVCQEVMEVTGADRSWASDVPIDPGVVAEGLDVIDSLVTAPLRIPRHPLGLMSRSVVDVVLPLIWVGLTLKPTRAHALRLADSVYERMLETQCAREVPVYKHVSKALLRGESRGAANAVLVRGLMRVGAKS